MNIQPRRRYSRNSFDKHVKLGINRDDIFWKGEERLEGFDPIERRPIAGVSDYDQTKWPKSRWPAKSTHRTKDIDDTFLLAANEYEDLCFTKRRIPRSDLVAHEYLSCELEFRAWEKYGGQVGLDAARVRRREQLDVPVNALAAPARNEDVNNRNVNANNRGRKRAASLGEANSFNNLASRVQDIHIRRVEGISPSLPATFSSISNSLSPSPQRPVNDVDNLFSRPHHLFASGSTSGGSAFQASDLLEFCKSFDVNEDHGTPEASPSPAKRRKYNNAGDDIEEAIYISDSD